jgi:hypothetical protein
MDWSLVIHGYPGYASVLGELVQGALQLEPVSVENLDQAREQVRKRGTANCKLIVSSLSAPLDTEVSSPVACSTPTALEFLKEVRGSDDVPACLLLVSSLDTARAGLLGEMKNVALLVADGTLRTRLKEAGLRLVGAEPDKSRAAAGRLDVDITLSGSIGRWYLSNEALGLTDNGVINIDRNSLRDLQRESRLLPAIRPEAAEEISELIRSLGQRLYQCVLDNRCDARTLGEEVYRITERLNLLGSARFRFEVDDDASPIVVETLARPNPADQDDLWSLRVPIFRRASGRGGRAPLFKDAASRTGPASCLVIEGETGPFNAGGHVNSEYGALEEARREIEWLAGHLQKPRFGLGPVTLVRASDHPDGDFAAALLEVLGSRDWNLVHYSGHSEIGDDNRPYLVLGSHRHDLLDVDTFARSAANAQFVFLNSCSSANLRFVRQLVEQSIPAVAGYAWPIPDDVAAMFSKQFYRELFPDDGPRTRGFIEYAFTRARAAVYENKRNGLWTAPVLFMQTMRVPSQQVLSTTEDGHAT